MDAVNDFKNDCQRELTSMLSCFFGLITGSFAQGTSFAVICLFYILLKLFDSSIFYTELYEVSAEVKFYVVW